MVAEVLENVNASAQPKSIAKTGGEFVQGSTFKVQR